MLVSSSQLRCQTCATDTQSIAGVARLMASHAAWTCRPSTTSLRRRNKAKHCQLPSQRAEVLEGSPGDWVLQVRRPCLTTCKCGATITNLVVCHHVKWSSCGSAGSGRTDGACMLQVLGQQGARQRSLLQRLAAQHLAGYVLQPGNSVVLPLMGQDVLFRVRPGCKQACSLQSCLKACYIRAHGVLLSIVQAAVRPLTTPAGTSDGRLLHCRCRL